MVSREALSPSQSPSRSSEQDPVTKLDLTELKINDSTRNVSKNEEKDVNNSKHRMKTD